MVVVGAHLYAVLILGARVGRLSLAKALRAMHRAIEALRHGETCAWLLRWFREALGDEYERHPPKRARDWPYKKNERPPGPPKLRRLPRSEKARIRELLMNHHMVFG